MASVVTRLGKRVSRGVEETKKAVVGGLRQIHLQSNNDWRNTVFLAGSGRGGTTWIAEIINYDNAYRFIFEPFSATHVPLCRDFKRGQYIRPDDEAPAFIEPARIVLSGAFRNAWTDYYNHRLYSHQRLVKDIRANLFLRWLHRWFPGMPLVLLMRHPCAVVSSRLHLRWSDNLEEFLGQPQLMSDFLEPFRERIEACTDAVGRHTVRWCIENWVPLQQFKHGDIHLAFYEDFCDRPHRAIEGLFAYLRRPVNEKIFARLDKPSSQARRKTRKRPGSELRSDSWRSHVTADQLHRVLDVLGWFGMDAIYNDAPAPDAAAANQMLVGS